MVGNYLTLSGKSFLQISNGQRSEAKSVAFCHISKFGKRFPKKNIELSIVLEDDAKPLGFERVTELFIPDDADFVFINDRTSLSEGKNESELQIFCIPFSITLQKLNAKEIGAGTDGYILTLDGARKLLKAIARDFCCGTYRRKTCAV